MLGGREPPDRRGVDFYAGLFGWEFEDVMPPGSNGKYFIARLRGGSSCRRRLDPGVGACDGCVGHIYLGRGAPTETASKVRAAGGGVAREPSDVMDAGGMAVFTDPEGAAFCVWGAKEHKGARVVNEHGALSFNGLNTREVDGAKAFYGSVFGWKTMQLGAGSKRGRCPATGTISSATTPTFRVRVAELGGPAGFENVVASINPIPDDQPDTSARWSVTFGVDDADATAAKAAELGGTVVVTPFDAPWSRWSSSPTRKGRPSSRASLCWRTRISAGRRALGQLP